MKRIFLLACLCALLIPAVAHAANTANVWIDTNGGTCTVSATQVTYASGDATSCASAQSAYNVMTSTANTARYHEPSSGTINYGTQNITGSRTTGWYYISVEGLAGTATVGRSTFAGPLRLSVNSIVLNGMDATGTLVKNLSLNTITWTAGVFFDNLSSSNITFNGGTFNNIDGDPRIHLAYSSTVPSGVTVENMQFSGGNADGIQTGAPLTIDNNEFTNLFEGACGSACHTDPIQIGEGAVTITDNWIHNTADGIVEYDGGGHHYIANNGIRVGDSGREGLELYFDDTSTVVHNTVVKNTACAANGCGEIDLNRKTDGTQPNPGHDTVVQDNVAYVVQQHNGSTAGVNDHNFVGFASGGTNELVGTITFATGGSGRCQYKAAATSTAHNSASDGTDRGINDCP